jgi:hypothetical protein
MDWIKLEFIQGHAPRTEGEKYGEVTPEAMLAEIKKHPRYEVKAALTVDRRRKNGPRNKGRPGIANIGRPSRHPRPE